MMSNKTFKAFMALVTTVAGLLLPNASRRLRCAFMVTRPQRGGSISWYVRVRWHYGQEQHVGRFVSVDEAQNWITESAEGWLRPPPWPLGSMLWRGVQLAFLITRSSPDRWDRQGYHPGANFSGQTSNFGPARSVILHCSLDIGIARLTG